MAVFEDLTPYSYLREEGDPPTLLNVGWLGRGSRFGVGEPEPGLVAALLALAVFRPVNTTRGFHLCEFCDPQPGDDPEPLVVPFEAAERGEVMLGGAEVRVQGPDGAVYAAPTLIAHYVDRHGYRPPAEFTRAALDLASADERAWAETKRTLPIATPVRGVVAGRYLSGLEITLTAGPDVAAFIPTDSYRPGGAVVEPVAFPAVGTPVEAVVIEHAERGRRVILRVGPA
ncbi:hypothetical protein ACRAKI_26050 [Saccharothrix isguenensis]